MQKNVAGQKWVVFAFDETDNTAKAGDAANITANLRIDGGAANAVDDANPTELEDGYYIFDITQAESNGDYILMCPASTTANIQVIGVPGALWTTPANYNAHSIDANGRIDIGKWLGQAVTVSAGNLPDVNVAEISDDSAAADNCEAEYDGTGYIHVKRGTNVALDTTLAVRTSDTVFTINAGSAVNDAYNNMVLALYDVSGSLWETRRVSDYVGATKTVTVDTAFKFVVAANDIVRIFQNAYAPTVAAGGGATAAEVWQYDVSAMNTSGQAGVYQRRISHLHR